MKEKEVLTKFAKATYNSLLNNDDQEVLKVVVDMLSPIWRAIDEEVADGLGHELWLWAGLKADGSDIAKDYGDGIMKGYNECLK